MKMRQKIAYGLCAFYLLSVMGIALSLHFCGNKLSSVDFTKKVNCNVCKSMGNEKMAKKDNCCKNTTVESKITDQHQSASNVDLPTNFSIALLFTPMIAEFLQSILPGLFTKIANKAPPLSTKTSLHLFNCFFRN
ncbi:hypothetical protein AAKU52_000843 [Pedobacter sp. CG_S7]|uniref:HYC_CC_PP family protein n=1 Tax=Pedobacter sp. CG_S7 TaxID=3143930 RepID=UPI003392FDCE